MATLQNSTGAIAVEARQAAAVFGPNLEGKSADLDVLVGFRHHALWYRRRFTMRCIFGRPTWLLCPLDSNTIAEAFCGATSTTECCADTILLGGLLPASTALLRGRHPAASLCWLHSLVPETRVCETPPLAAMIG